MILDTEVLGVSRDNLKSHAKFIEALEGLPFPLLADTESQVCNAYDVIKDKNMYGKMVKGIERSTFLIDVSGRIAAVWRKVKVDGHAQEVLAAVKKLAANNE
jgi:peroxiredoxin Q/BCP